MAGRPRLPDAMAKATGAAAKNPQRFRDRKPPKSPPLGKPPRTLGPDEVEAWETFADELPWLCKADRTVLEIASRLAAAMRRDFLAFPISGIAQLRMCLTQMGATPADRSKVGGGKDEDDEDPLDAFIN